MVILERSRVSLTMYKCTRFHLLLSSTTIIQQLANKSSDMAICNHIDQRNNCKKMDPIQQLAKTMESIKEFANTALWYFNLQKSYPEQQLAKTRDNMMCFQKLFGATILKKVFWYSHSQKSKGRDRYINSRY